MTGLFEGVAVALATPFTGDGAIDEAAFRGLVRHVVAGGSDVLVPLGTTGEAATLDESERDALLTACLEEAGGRPVVAGTGHNATAQAARWTRRAQQLGCAGALVVSPYYNKPMPEGIVAHYAAVAEAAPGLPLIAYNVPGRTGVNLDPALVAELWRNPQIVALKESSRDLGQIGAIAATLPPGKTLLCGDDQLAVASIATGARGLVSVAANVLPAEVCAVVAAARAGDFANAREREQRLLPLYAALFQASNPIPLKAALALRGLAEMGVRLPLTPASPAVREALERALAAFA